MANYPGALDSAASLFSPVDAFSAKPLETTTTAQGTFTIRNEIVYDRNSSSRHTTKKMTTALKKSASLKRGYSGSNLVSRGAMARNKLSFSMIASCSSSGRNSASSP